jgi:uncharacterized protein YjiS (DUF1127 family)
MTTQTVSHDGAFRENAGARVGRLNWRRLAETVIEWRRRARSRRELAGLTALDLKDIGYPDRAAAELAKPFWRS